MEITDFPVEIQNRIIIDAQAIKARATIKNPSDLIHLSDIADAAKFRAGDNIKIEESNKNRQQ